MEKIEVIRHAATTVEGLDFILGHFQEPIWPRTISTQSTEGRQVLAYNKEEVLAWFEAANFLDCRINGYHDYTVWNGINRQSPNLIFIDLDLCRFKSQEALDKGLKMTLKNIGNRLHGGYPSVLHSGNGYHILQPIEAFVLESEDVFNKFENPSKKFLRFAEPYLTNNKADPSHSNSLSFKNCILRVPGSHNYKCVLRNNGIADRSTEVKIIQRWNGSRPAVTWLLRDFRRYLIQEKINNTFNDAKLKRRSASHSTTSNRSISWIDSLLETPIEDHRKYAVWRILAPYLINIRKLSYDEAFIIIKVWLNKCNGTTPLDFNANNRIKDNLKAAMKVGYLPISLNNVKEENKGLYNIVVLGIENL